MFLKIKKASCYDMNMIIFLGIFAVLTFAFVYFFQLVHLPLLGFQMVAFLLLVFSFLSKKSGKISPIVGMNIILLFSLLAFYFSNKYFTFINHGDVEKVILILVSFVVAQVMGIFWGRLFYAQEHRKEKNKSED